MIDHMFYKTTFIKTGGEQKVAMPKYCDYYTLRPVIKIPKAIYEFENENREAQGVVDDVLKIINEKNSELNDIVLLKPLPLNGYTSCNNQAGKIKS